MSNTLYERAESELNITAQANAAMIQSMVDEAQIINVDLVDYTNAEYSRYLELLENQSAGAPAMPKEESRVYGIMFDESSFDAEQYFLNTLWSAVRNYDFISGLGVLFEPYAFDVSVEKFALYVNASAAAQNSTDVAFTDDYFQEEYYTEAKETGKVFITDPFMYEGNSVVTLSTPFVVDGNFIGVATADINTDAFEEAQATNEDFPTLYSAIINSRGQYIMHSGDSANIGRTYSDIISDAGAKTELADKMQLGASFIAEVDDETVVLSPIHVADDHWWMVTGLETSDLTRITESYTWQMVGLAAGCLIVALLVMLRIVTHMLSPLKNIVSVADEISRGSFENRIEVKNHDEIGLLADRFNSMSDTLHGLVSEIQRLLSSMSDGDFDVSISNENIFVGNLGEIKGSLEKIITDINNAMRDIRSTSEHVAISAAHVSEGAQITAHGSAKQNMSIETLSGTLHTLLNRVNENTTFAREANEISAKTGDVVADSSEKMKKLMDAILQIQNTSNDIGKIIKTIDGIAFQTNILALNAAVEASRAGSAGQGFAVVAQEVRNLAQRSSEAAQDTNALIIKSLDAVKAGTNLAMSTNESFTEAANNSKQMLEMIAKIAQSSEDQIQGITEITDSLRIIENEVQAVSATSEQSASASEELTVHASRLDSLVSNFKLKG